MKFYQLVLLTLFYCAASFAQTAEDAAILSFKAALEESDQAHLDTFHVFKDRYQEELSACPFRIKFYKTYSNFHYSQERDDLVLVLQRDSILPLQQSCLAANHDAINTTLLNIARSYHYLTEYGNEDFLEEAESYYLLVNEQQANSDSITPLYSKRYKDIAEFYYYTKDYKKAALYYESALNIYSGDKKSIVYIRLLLGRADCLRVDKRYHEAIRQLEEAERLTQHNSDDLSVEQSKCYDRLATCYKSLQQYELAEKNIIKARQIEQRQAERDLYTANAFASRHAQILKLAGKYDEAFAVYQEVREIIKASGDKVTIEEISGINEDFAGVYYSKGEYKKAIELYHKGMSDLVSSCPADVYLNPPIAGNRIFNLQYLQRQLGLKAKAMMAHAEANPSAALYNGALNAILKFDSLGQQILKLSWEEETHQIRIKELSPFYEIGIRAALALHVLDGKSSHLNAAHQICSRYKSQLLHRGISIKERKQAILSDALKQRESALKKNISDYETKYLIDLAAENKTTESLKQYLDEKAALDKFHNDNKVFEVIDNAVPNTSISMAEIRSKLNEQTALLEYFVTHDSVFAFLISSDKIQYQVSSNSGLDQFFKYLDAGEGLDRSDDVSPLIALLNNLDKESVKNLIVIPDQELLLLPFEALKLNGEYLVGQFNISYQYSASFFANEKGKPLKKNYLGFASDYSVKINSGASNFESLPFAVDEVNAAKKQFNGRVFVNGKATKSNFLSNCENARLIHFALHTQLNNQYPDQSTLVFQSDSSYEYLTASEIYNLDLSNDLSVLSACNTAVGQINPGDGIRSITRSFIHAGSASVLTTLWEAPDVSTSQIINKFYQELEAGLPKDRALRNAKLDYIKNVQPSYQHPKYWAHLVMVGNTDSLFQNVNNEYLMKIIIGIFVLLLLLLLYFLKRKR